MACPLSPSKPFGVYGDKLNYAREPKGPGIDSGQMHHNTYPNGPDTGTAITQLFRIKGVPETYILGPDGVLRSVGIGPFVNSKRSGHQSRLSTSSCNPAADSETSSSDY